MAAPADKGITTVREKSTGSDETTLKEQEPVTLKFYTTSPTDKTEIDYAIGKWNEKNPNIMVECTVITDDGMTKIRTAIVGGKKRYSYNGALLFTADIQENRVFEYRFYSPSFFTNFVQIAIF